MRSGRSVVAESVSTRNGQREAAFSGAVAAVRSYADLPIDWDRYGGAPAQDRPVTFAVALLEELADVPSIPVPTVRPISGGVYLEWRFGEWLLYFEVDGESALAHVRGPELSETSEDAAFDVARAKQAVIEYIEADLCCTRIPAADSVDVSHIRPAAEDPGAAVR
jgi:hypothetical protein